MGFISHDCRNPTLKECEDDTHIPEMGIWESSEIPENLELDYKHQNTSPWGFLYLVGKVLKRRCRKWPRMGHSDIYSTSYVQKKGRESNWQFDSRPLKVGNRPDSGACRQSAAHRRKALKENYKFALNLIPIGGLSKEWWAAKVSRVQSGRISRQFQDSHLGVPGQTTIWMCTHGVAQNILYGGRWWLPPSPGQGESSESRVASGLS
jgi:hypothetical protein